MTTRSRLEFGRLYLNQIFSVQFWLVRFIREIIFVYVLCSKSCTTGNSRISVIPISHAVINMDGASATDTVLSIKKRIYAANSKLYVRRQRLVYSAGPHGQDALADYETLGGAGVATDGTAELDVLLVSLTAAEEESLGPEVLLLFIYLTGWSRCFIQLQLHSYRYHPKFSAYFSSFISILC